MPISRRKIHLSTDETHMLRSLKDFIHHSLLKNDMTLDDLVAYLMSEPYLIGPNNLHLVAEALGDLKRQGLLSVTFKPNPEKLTVTPVFKTTLRKSS